MSSTLPHKIDLVKRCYNIAATFVSNEHTVIIEQSTRDLKILLAHLIRIFNIFFLIICPKENDVID